MVYFPRGGSASLDLSAFAGDALKTWWYDPRTGAAFPGDSLEKSANVLIASPTAGRGNDWVLVIDVAGAGYQRPGVVR